MKKDKYFLIVNEWPTEGCRKVKSFDSYEAASKAGHEFVLNHIGTENKILIIHGEILSLSPHYEESEGVQP